MEKKLTYYNIYGFVIAVDEGMKKAFDLEYWRFRTKNVRKVDVYVLKTNKKDLPVKLRAATKGIYIPFGTDENKVLYEKGVPGDWVLYSIEPLIHWKDKCFIHSGAVEDNEKAILFPAEGGVGKTTMVTYLIKKGYGYLSDDWLIIGKYGKAYPFFKTVHVFDYNLKNKEIAKRVLGKKRYLYKLLFFVLNLIPKIIPSRFARIVAERLKPIFSVDIANLYPDAKLGRISKIKKVYWLKKDKRIKKPILKKADYRELSDKMPYITALETNHFYKNYYEWVYTHQKNKEIENRIKHDKKIMLECFRNADVYELLVPDKINPEEIYNLIK